MIREKIEKEIDCPVDTDNCEMKMPCAKCQADAIIRFFLAEVEACKKPPQNTQELTPNQKIEIWNAALDELKRRMK